MKRWEPWGWDWALGRILACPTRASTCGRVQKPNANGAGIAADPTLTGVWMLRLLPDLRRTFDLCFRQRMLGARCLAPVRLHLAMLRSGIRHRRSRRHPAFASALLRSTVPEGPVFRRHAQSPGRDRFPFPTTRTTDWGLSPFPLHFCPTRGLACPAPSRRTLLKRANLPLAEASCMPSLDGHGD